MISHALTIVVNEVNTFHKENFRINGGDPPKLIELGNLAEGFGGASKLNKEIVNLSLVNIREEKSLKNIANYVRDDVTLKARYENPPTFLNFQILVAATHGDYSIALTKLSRVIRFFQFKNVLTHDNVNPESMLPTPAISEADRLETFKLIFDLYSPTMEEVNHLWGTLGGKQYPFAIYLLRMLELKFKAIQHESELITNVVSEFHLKN
jgi:hypothetical protein